MSEAACTKLICALVKSYYSFTSSEVNPDFNFVLCRSRLEVACTMSCICTFIFRSRDQDTVWTTCTIILHDTCNDILTQIDTFRCNDGNTSPSNRHYFIWSKMSYMTVHASWNSSDATCNVLGHEWSMCRAWPSTDGCYFLLPVH